MIETQQATRGSRYNLDAGGSRLLWSRHQIIMMLRRFVREDRPVSVHYDDEDKVVVTRTLGVDADLDRVYFEYGDHKANNLQMLRCRDVRFSVEDGSAKSLFSSPRIRDVLLEGKPVFQIQIPDRIVQADRRLHQRIKIPEVSAPVVVVNLPDGRKAEGRLADMSAGGIGVIGLAADLKVKPGTVIRNCLILLGDNERVVVDLEIRHGRVAMGADGTLMHHVGFSLASRPKEFSDLLNAFTVEF